MIARNDAPAPARTPAHRPPLHPRRRAAALVGAILIAACVGDDRGADDPTATTGATTSTSGTSSTSATSATTTTTATTSTSATASTTAGETTGTSDASSTGGDPALAALCLAVEGSIAEGLAGDCACAVEAGEHPSVDACLADKGIDPGLGACRCDIVAAAPEMAPYLECLKPVAADFAACIDALGCDDPDALDNCYFVFLQASECPPSIPAVDAEVEYVCRGASPFACGSGEEVPDTWLCDLEDDCVDGSDEAECPFFECQSGDEIPLRWRCDGAPDCPDGDDEVDCPP